MCESQSTDLIYFRYLAIS